MQLSDLALDVALLIYTALGDFILFIGAALIVASFLYSLIAATIFVIRNQ